MYYIVGVSYELGLYFFDVELYWKNLDGLLEYIICFIFLGFGFNSMLNYEEFFYIGNGVVKGIEFLV